MLTTLPNGLTVVVAPTTRRRKWVFAAAAAALALGTAAAALVALDVYLHRRVQNFAAANVWGYRGPTIGAKQANEKRIVVLGGSTAFGFGLPWNEAFPYQLERGLNARAVRNRRYTVVNLGAPAQGAFGFQFDLADYAYLKYDVAIFYEGYNDLGLTDLPNAVPPRDAQNRFLWRRQSPVFRLTGYFPVLPLVFREKAMSLRAGGDLDGAYRGRVMFQSGVAARASAAALQRAADVADAFGRSLGRVAGPGAGTATALDTVTWHSYTDAVVTAVRMARARGVKTIVVTQPYASQTHVSQQAALVAALQSAFGGDPDVRYVNLGSLLDIRDPEVSIDGLHLRAPGNRLVASRLIDPVLELLP